MEVPPTRGAIEAALEGLVALNCHLMAAGRLGRGKVVPRLARAGVRYKREPPRREQWKNAHEVAADKQGDCEDLACYLAAEYRVYNGEPARAVVYQSAPRRWHAVVLRANGEVVDIAALLGMGHRRAK